MVALFLSAHTIDSGKREMLCYIVGIATILIDEVAVESPERLGTLVRRLARLMSAEISRRLKAYDVTLAQLQLLKQLWKREGRSQAELQELLDLDRATVAGLVQRMIAQNLIERQPDPVDKRIQRVFTTERGRSLQSVPAIIEDEVTAKTLQGFSEDERMFLTRLLARALQNIDSG